MWAGRTKRLRFYCARRIFTRHSSSSSASHQVGFIGLGKIGFAMASNICSKHKLLVYDMDTAQSTRLRNDNKKDNIEIATSASAVASNCDMLITALPNDKILSSVVESEIYRHQPPDSVHISCSTVSPDTSAYLAQLQREHNGTQYVSAPVFARPDGMMRGEATIPISGASHAVREQQVKPILSLTSTAVYDFGDDVRAANIVKICGNFLIASAIESMAESFTLADKNNVDRVLLKQMLTETIFNCLIYNGYGHRVATFDHAAHLDAHFALQLGFKDVNLVCDTAQKSNVSMPVADVLQHRFETSMGKNRDKLDWSAIALSVNEDAGLDMTETEAACFNLNKKL